METLNLAPETTNNLPGLIVAYRNQSALKTPVKEVGDRFTLKSAGSYLLVALAEGLKQNLLGPNVNMEFLMLSVRAYLIRLASFTVGYQERIINDHKPVKRISMRNISNVRIFNNPLKLILQ